MKKFLSIMMSIVLATTVVSCAPKSKTNDTASNSGSNSNSDSGEIVELDLWHIWPDTDITDGKTVKDFVEIYEKENPNVKINVETSEIGSYKDKLKVIFSGNELPDVFFTYGAGFTKPLVESGKVLKIDDYLDEETRGRLLPGIEENFIYNDSLYGLPVKMWVGVMYVNREIFEKEGLEYPTTFEELVEVSKTFRERGYQPMTLGAKEAWHAAMYHDIISVQEATVSELDKMFAGEESFNNPAILETAKKMRTLVDEGVFNDGFIAQGAQEAQAEFLMGKIPMYFNGSWLTGDIQSDDNQVKDKIDVIPFPTTNQANGNKEFTGGAIDGYAVASTTKYPDVAVDFMQKLTEYQSIEGYKTGNGISTWESDVDVSELNPVLVQISDLLANATGYCLAWDTKLSGADIDNYLTALQSLITGKLTPEEYVKYLSENLNLEQ